MRKEDVEKMKNCILAAKKLIREERLADFQSDVIAIAIALFNR